MKPPETQKSPNYDELAELEFVLEASIGNWFFRKPTSEIVAREYLPTDDVERTLSYLCERWRDGFSVKDVKFKPQIHPEKISEIYERGTKYNQKLLPVMEQYKDTLLLINADFRELGVDGCADLLTRLVENKPSNELQETWRNNRVYLLLVPDGRDYNFYVSEPYLKGKVGNVRPPAHEFHILWGNYKNVRDYNRSIGL